MTNKPEVLSPAGSMETLIAAVRSGADAVYLGAQEFNARRSAENFSSDRLKNAVDYCHIRGVRVYLTLNILIRDDELDSAVRLAADAYAAGIDGIIVQDCGLASVLHACIPALPLHASTQMSVHSVSALAPLKSSGFRRVVAAREMNHEQLRELCSAAAELEMQVEVFVHGALCMCLSGQCMLSSMLGTRSGNRGMCAGPCRLPFSTNGSKDEYALSLKDLSLIGHMNELMSMGVASLKIEGRMKRPEYVAAATAAVRAAVYSLPDNGLNTVLRDVFSRSGFTDGYFTGRVDASMFGIRTRDDVASSKQAFPLLHELYRGERRSVGVDIKITLLAGKPVRLEISDGINTVSAEGEAPQPAVNKAVASGQVSELAAKLGGTPFYAVSTEVRIGDNLFVSAAALNSLRRECIEKLCAVRARVTRPVPEYTVTAPHTAPQPPLSYIIRISDPAQLAKTVWNSRLKAVAVPLELTDTGLPIPDGIEKIADIPRGITDEGVLKKLLNRAADNGFTCALCGNIAAVTLAAEAGLKIIADFGMNIYNSHSAAWLARLGADAFVVSPELSMSKALNIGSDLKKGIFAYGRLPLMLLKNCPVKAKSGCGKCGGRGSLNDRLGVTFPVRCRMGFSELYNSVPVYLADRKKDISGFGFAVLYFTDETPEQAAKITAAYCSNGDSPPHSPHTRGLYYRNVE